MLIAKFIHGLGKIVRRLSIPAIFKKFFSIIVLDYTGDWVGYKTLIKFIKEHDLMKLPGDFIEIGSFVGGGTAKLARFANKFGKRVYTIDIFNINVDNQKNKSGVIMSKLYSSYLRRINMSQWQAYQHMVKGLTNVVTIKNDSMKVKFHNDKKFVFGFIDGNHEPKYVMSDFYLIWRHLVSGGAVVFHDYGGDLPQVTKTINFLISKHQNEINRIWLLRDKYIIFLVKRNKNGQHIV